jgi:hypothetical protein
MKNKTKITYRLNRLISGPTNVARTKPRRARYFLAEIAGKIKKVRGKGHERINQSAKINPNKD